MCRGIIKWELSSVCHHDNKKCRLHKYRNHHFSTTSQSTKGTCCIQSCKHRKESPKCKQANNKQNITYNTKRRIDEKYRNEKCSRCSCNKIYPWCSSKYQRTLIRDYLIFS